MNSRRFWKNHDRQHKPGQRGIALITMLLLLSLLTALSLSMVMVFSSDMFMNGYNRNFRASFYAADAGSAIVRQDMENRLTALLPTSLAVGGAAPLSNTAQTGIATAINSAYGTPFAINSAGSFAESFKLYTANTSLTLYSCAVSSYTDATQSAKAPVLTNTSATLNGNIACPTPAFAYAYSYTYHYSLTTVGTASGSGGTAATDSGNVIINATSTDTPNNFSQYGTFIDQQTICAAELVGGTITGPQFTNGAWTFGQGQSYNFTGTVGSVGADAGYLFSNGTCNQVAGPKSTLGGATISPTFQKGQQLAQQHITLPTDDFNQKSAVLTGVGVNSNGTEPGNPTTAQLTAALKDSSGVYSYTGPSDTGVFVPVSSTTGLVNGGGLYVEGNATVSLSTSGTTGQVYSITQGGTTTTVTITPGATPGSGTTVIKKGANPATTYNGVPTQTDPNSGIQTDAVVLYIDGNITSLSGTIQNNTGVNVTAATDITVTNNLVYATPVVNSSGTETTAAAAGTELQALGLYTAGGSVYVQAGSNNANIEIDASIMVTKDNGGTCDFGNSCTGVLGVTGSKTIGTLEIVGGRIQSRAMIMPAGTIGTRNVYFDQRYNGTFAPPFFPKLTTLNTPPLYATTLQRTGWVLQTAY